MFGSRRQMEPVQRAGDWQGQALSAGQFLSGRLSRKDSRRAAGTDLQRLRGQLHPDQGTIAEPYYAFDYVPCGVGEILRETAGGGRGTDYPVDSKQISSGAAVSSGVRRIRLSERGFAALGCRLRVSRRVQYLSANSPPMQAQRRCESARLRQELHPLLPAQRVDRERPVPKL